MSFNKIDMGAWKRAKTFEHFTREVPCTYSMTVNIDAAKLLRAAKERGIGFFPAFLHCLARVVNAHEEFRMDFDAEGRAGYYDESHPCWAVFDHEDESFTTLWAEYSPDFAEFFARYDAAMRAFKDGRASGPPAPRNVFNVSCIPWTSFTGFNLNLRGGYSYLPPVFTVGKYSQEGSRAPLPLAIQAHHATCDGWHVSRFIRELQETADSFQQRPSAPCVSCRGKKC